MKGYFKGSYDLINIDLIHYNSVNNSIKKHFNTNDVYYIKGSKLENKIQFSVNGKEFTVIDFIKQ